MSKESVSIRDDNTPDKPKWGLPNPRRGAGYADIASAFVRDFPTGTTLSQEQFDKWSHEHGHLNVPFGASTQSDVWKAHLQRRHELRYNINLAGTHPRTDVPFVIETLAPGVLEVRSPIRAIGKSKDTRLRKLETLTGTHRRQLGYLMQSVDWETLPPYERLFAESLYDDIDAFEGEIERKVDSMSAKFSKLESRLRRAVEAGEIEPKNGGIKAIIAPSKEDVDPSGD